jgi:hypothetical protein
MRIAILEDDPSQADLVRVWLWAPGTPVTPSTAGANSSA